MSGKMGKTVNLYFSLGTNLGDRLENLRRAIELIHREPGFQVTALSSIYQTEPVGYLEQPDFLNMVVAAQTRLSPVDCYKLIQKIESNLQRKREIRFGPRTMDIDLLLYGDAIIEEERLQVPHPRMTERAFVLIPLAEVAGDIDVPGYGDIRYLVQGISGKEGVRLWRTKPSLIELGLLEN